MIRVIEPGEEASLFGDAFAIERPSPSPRRAPPAS
jgi:hypothetical protein